MCHESWLRGRLEESEASCRVGDVLEHARPLSDRDVADQRPEDTLGKPGLTPLAGQH
jgi:hypothetical protein